jgi:hypothetical protein
MRFFFISIFMALILIGCSKPSAEEMFNQGVDAQKAEQYDAAIASFQELIKAYPTVLAHRKRSMQLELFIRIINNRIIKQFKHFVFL